MTRVARSVASIAVLSLGLTTRAAADPVSITSGFLLVTDPLRSGPVAISGTRGFSLTGLASPGEGLVRPFHLECDPVCMPGETISLGAVFSGTALSGMATLDGNSYTLTGDLMSLTNAILRFDGLAIIPPLDQTSTVVTASFSLIGGLTPPDGRTIALRGLGIATLALSLAPPRDFIPPGWTVESIRYDFAAPSPVPEPATLTLLATGLGTLVAGRRRRSKRAS